MLVRIWLVRSWSEDVWSEIGWSEVWSEVCCYLVGRSSDHPGLQDGTFSLSGKKGGKVNVCMNSEFTLPLAGLFEALNLGGSTAGYRAT